METYKANGKKSKREGKSILNKLKGENGGRDTKRDQSMRNGMKNL